MIRCTAYLCWVLGFLFFTFPYFYFLSYFYYFYICISIFEFGFSYHSLERAISALLCWDFPLFCFSTTFINHSGIRNDRKGCISLWKHKWFAQTQKLYFSAKHKWFAGNKSSGSSRVCAQDGKITFSWKKDKVSDVLTMCALTEPWISGQPLHALYSTLHCITHENMFCTLFTKITTIKKYFGLVEPQLENEGGREDKLWDGI